MAKWVSWHHFAGFREHEPPIPAILSFTTHYVQFFFWPSLIALKQGGVFPILSWCVTPMNLFGVIHQLSDSELRGSHRPRRVMYWRYAYDQHLDPQGQKWKRRCRWELLKPLKPWGHWTCSFFCLQIFCIYIYIYIHTFMIIYWEIG